MPARLGEPAINPDITAGKYLKHIEKVRYKTAAKPGEVRNPYGRRGKPLSEHQKKQIKEAMESRELVNAARRRAEKALKVLDDVIDSETSADTAKLAAAKEILDRAFGKPTQTNVNANVNADGKTSEIDNRELDQRLDQLVRRVEAASGREEEAPASQERSADLRKLN